MSDGTVTGRGTVTADFRPSGALSRSSRTLMASVGTSVPRRAPVRQSHPLLTASCPGAPVHAVQWKGVTRVAPSARSAGRAQLHKPDTSLDRGRSGGYGAREAGALGVRWQESCGGTEGSERGFGIASAAASGLRSLGPAME